MKKGNPISRLLIELFLIIFANVVYWYCKCITTIYSWISPNWISWSKYSEGMLRQLEKKILQGLKYRGWYVDIGPVIGPADKIWTISMNTDSRKTPLILLNGLGSGVALWVMNLGPLAQKRPVYALDLVGFGRSTRPAFSTDGLEAEAQMVASIEEWRKEMKLEKFILLGHSLGGFLATSYSISHPHRVNHLILSDPWGFPEKPKDYKNVPFWIKGLSYALAPFNPLAAVRAAGPFGPWFINALRPDISKKYSEIIDENLIPQYIYQCNSQTPSGESAFHAMMSDFGWAKNPMVNRIKNLRADVPITLLYGSRSWVDNSAREIIKEKRRSSFFNIKEVKGAGHHVYADKPEIFNQIVLEACQFADDQNILSITDKCETSQELVIKDTE